LASYVAPNWSRINERWVNIHTHDSAPYVASNSSQINKNSARYSQSDIDFKRAMLEFEISLEKQNEDFKNKYFGNTSKRPITSKSSAMSMKKEALPISTVSKVRIDSNVSKCSATKAEQYNILSESIKSQETSPAAEKNVGSARNYLDLNFQELKGGKTAGGYGIIDRPQIIAEQASVNKAYQDDEHEVPTSKKRGKTVGGAHETSQDGSRTG